MKIEHPPKIHRSDLIRNLITAAHEMLRSDGENGTYDMKVDALELNSACSTVIEDAKFQTEFNRKRGRRTFCFSERKDTAVDFTRLMFEIYQYGLATQPSNSGRVDVLLAISEMSQLVANAPDNDNDTTWIDIQKLPSAVRGAAMLIDRMDKTASPFNK